VATAPRRPYAPRLPPEERREQLLDAALGLIAEHGYDGVSMEGVAREAGVTKPVVYDIFPNRGELLRALLQREEERALRELATAIPFPPPADPDPDDVLVDGIVAYLRAVAANPRAWRLILLPTDGTPAEVREHVDQGRAQIMRQLETLIAWGLERRGGPADLDVDLAAQGLLAVGEHAARLVLTDPAKYSPERIGAEARKLLSALERGDSGS
jgi:AcrR family transcriptional regulator